MSEGRWEFWIDRGGTFTDCIGLDPEGALHTIKVLSSDAAPREAIRSLLEREGVIAASDPLPQCLVKLGSTVATNALLERRGAPTVLIADRGLGDVVRIGTQERPHLFELDIDLPKPLHQRTLEVGGRVTKDGEVLEALDEAAVRSSLEQARADGATSAAVVLIHSYAHPSAETRVRELAEEAGFEYAVASHEVARELGLLARGETTVADAYLTPLLRRHVDDLAAALPGSQLRFMQSSGGLTDAARFRGPNALLSGPAGGVVAAAKVAAQAGFHRAIAFDMGGTSSDVSLVEDGEVDRAFETVVGGIRVKAPMMRIHTVAAGGGSLCQFDGQSLSVGPESAGAWPGPLCYGRQGEAGVGAATQLALTDVNFALGRVQADRFPFALDRAPVDDALARQRELFEKAGVPRSADEVAAGYVEVANANMAQAIAEVSVARGVDPRDHALVGFGGAAGQHVCAIARTLELPRVILHPLAGLLSAYGIGLCDATWDGQRDAGRGPLPDDEHALTPEVRHIFTELEAQGRAALGSAGEDPVAIRAEHWLDLRYEGTDVPLSLREPSPGAMAGEWRAAFSREHKRRFGYERAGRTIEVVTARVRLASPAEGAAHSEAPEADARGTAPAATPIREESVYFGSLGRVATPIFNRESLSIGSEIDGPALVLEDAGTIVIDPGFRARVGAGSVLELWEPEGAAIRSRVDAGVDWERVDPVRLEVFGNRFMSIAEQMGASLRNTAVSTNIKERLDYSCAVFDADGGLVANAPHIPVHLGAMGETVRAVRARFADLADGDVVVTNDPFEGGSHLPDITVVTPVFLDQSLGSNASVDPSFYVASRGHHADVGGTTPGSMPPDSQSLEEEGVVLSAFRLVSGGVFEEAQLRERLAGARYPARRPDDNVADLEAMVAANRAGAHLLARFVDEQSYEGVSITMAQLQQAAARRVAREIGKLADGEHHFADKLDDGTKIKVVLEVRGEAMTIDFAGTAAAVAGNLNAPRAVVHAAVIYVLRSLVAERIPLNGGCLDPVEIRIPAGSLLDPPPGSAVVAGNVETSQRIVDVLLGALGIAGASQGTMNNVTFGDESFGYYETIGGGAGAGQGFDGASAVHTHMTNTRITDPEVLEDRYPVRLVRFAVREGSGGAGRFRGGCGIERCYEFMAPLRFTLLTERRLNAPYGQAGGAPGAPGRNTWIRAGSSPEELPSRCSINVEVGDRVLVETPGGGGFGKPEVD